MTKALNDTLSVKRSIKHFDFSAGEQRTRLVPRRTRRWRVWRLEPKELDPTADTTAAARRLVERHHVGRFKLACGRPLAALADEGAQLGLDPVFGPARADASLVA